MINNFHPCRLAPQELWPKGKGKPEPVDEDCRAHRREGDGINRRYPPAELVARQAGDRSEEHTSELQSLMRISYAVFCLTKKITSTKTNHTKASAIRKK